MTKETKARKIFRTGLASLVIYGGASMTIVSAANIATAVEPIIEVAMVDKTRTGAFEKSSFDIKGEWQIVEENGQTIFRLSEDFKTKNGPDLKLFLSPKTVGSVTGQTAKQNAVRLGVLKSSRGTQDYVIPENIDLSQFGSILIHCEAFSKLWGGANL